MGPRGVSGRLALTIPTDTSRGHQLGKGDESVEPPIFCRLLVYINIWTCYFSMGTCKVVKRKNSRTFFFVPYGFLAIVFDVCISVVHFCNKEMASVGSLNVFVFRSH